MTERPEMLSDTWWNRDLPVLVEAVRHFDRIEQPLDAETIAETLGIDTLDVMAAVRALEDGALLKPSGPGADARGGWLAGITPDARRATGAWPTPENTWDRLLAQVEERIEAATTEEEKTRWQRLRDGAAGVGRDLGVGVMTALIGGYLPGQ